MVVLKRQNVTLPLYMIGVHVLGPATEIATELADKLCHFSPVLVKYFYRGELQNYHNDNGRQFICR